MIRRRSEDGSCAAGLQPVTIRRGRCRSLTALVLLCVLASAAGCGSRELMPTPTLYLSPDEQPFAEVPEHFRAPTVDVLYVTDRRPETTEGGAFTYGSGRSLSMAFGSAVVALGTDLTWEELVVLSRAEKRETPVEMTLRSVDELGCFPPTPVAMVAMPERPIAVIDPYGELREQEMRAGLLRELRRRLALTPRKEALVYLHGNFSTFDEAVFTTAELWHFIGRRGVPIAYTWPSGGASPLLGYTYDRESGEFTVFHLKQFIRLLAECPELEKVHVVTHSRGTDVASAAFRELVIEARAAGLDPGERFKIGNVIMAAPDLDLEVATQRLAAERLFDHVERLTVYASPHDKAIVAANWLYASFMRVGQLRPEELTAVQRRLLESLPEHAHFVDVRIRSTGAEHYYFRTNPAVSSDIVRLIRDNADPGREHGRPLVPCGAHYWELREGYPHVSEAPGDEPAKTACPADKPE